MIYIGVLTYNLSDNMGDWYQTAAALYFWWKHFSPTSTFKQWLEECVRTGAMEGHPILWINRDTISTLKKPEDCERVVTLMNGWWMYRKNPGSYEHRPGDEYNFPPPDFVHPLYVSFHVVYKEILTQTVVEHFKRHEPIGCRDMATTRFFQEKGVNAYFSGCLTLAFDLRDERLGTSPTIDYSGVRVFVEAPLSVDDRTSLYTCLTQVRRCNLSPTFIQESIQNMVNLLGATSVTTRRLHVWLPLLANGVTTTLWNEGTKREFQIGDKDRVETQTNRFEGLLELRDRLKMEEVKRTLSADVLARIKAAF